MKTGFLTFVFLCWERASKGSFLLTDRLSIFLIPAATVVYWLVQKAGFVSSDMNINVSELVSFVVVFTVLGVILMRLIASPYLVWKDQNLVIAKLDAELAKPEQMERRWLADYVAEARAELSKNLAILSHLAFHTNVWISNEDDTQGVLEVRTERLNQFSNARHAAFVRAEELSYIPGLRMQLLDFMNTCERQIALVKEGGDTRGILKEVSDKRNAVLRTLHHR